MLLGAPERGRVVPCCTSWDKAWVGLCLQVLSGGRWFRAAPARTAVRPQHQTGSRGAPPTWRPLAHALSDFRLPRHPRASYWPSRGGGPLPLPGRGAGPYHSFTGCGRGSASTIPPPWRGGGGNAAPTPGSAGPSWARSPPRCPRVVAPGCRAWGSRCAGRCWRRDGAAGAGLPW